jgi:membrane associated rhomboid family serine protease
MIPLSDIDRRPLQFPLITALIVGINIIVFLLEIFKGSNFILRWSFVPSEIASRKDLITIITAMFMHGSVLHILGNMLYLWAFGPEIEDLMGRFWYTVFYLSGGLAASIAQVVINPASNIPSLGASGAIAAVMGAFIVAFPHDRIRTILFLGFFFTISFVPTILLIGFWFLMQLFSEVGTLINRKVGAGGIAYMAHVGGFVFGIVLMQILKFSRKHET